MHDRLSRQHRLQGASIESGASLIASHLVFRFRHESQALYARKCRVGFAVAESADAGATSAMANAGRSRSGGR